MKIYIKYYYGDDKDNKKGDTCSISRGMKQAYKILIRVPEG
jgi:hypothetical protein